MKTKTIIIFAVSMVLTASLVYAQPWRGWKGSGGWGYNSKYQRMYDPQTVTTVKGVVEAVEQMTPMKGMSYGVTFKTENRL